MNKLVYVYGLYGVMFLVLTTTKISAKYKPHKSCKFYLYLKFLIEGNVGTAHLVLPSPALLSHRL